MGAMDVLKKWDFYKKIPEDLTVSTLPGVSLSIAGCFIMFLLFVLEFNAYLTVDYRHEIVMDEGLDQTLRINFNVTVPDLPCEFASVDVSDMTGTRKHNMTKNIYKIRLDHKGRHVGLANEEQRQPTIDDATAYYDDLPESDAVVTALDDNTFEPFLKEHHYVAVDFYAPWCIWCQRLEPVWQRVAKTLPSLHYGQRMRVASVDCQAHPGVCMKQFIRAYPTILFYKDGDIAPVEMYFGDRTAEAFIAKFKQLFDGETDAVEVRKKQLHEQDKKEAAAQGKAIARATGPEGCRLYGHLDVKRVPGNFHVHLANPAFSMDHALVNASHRVDELWFGEHLTSKQMAKLPAAAQQQLYTHRLEGLEFTAYNSNHTYVHYIKVVTNAYHTTNEPVTLYKYTAHSNEYQEPDDLPSIMFRYDLSPMAVKITQFRVPFYHFLTNACAIIGGVFTVIGIIDQIVHQTARAMNKKVL